MSKRPKASSKPEAKWPPSRARLETLLEDALVDAYGESEERTGIYTKIEEYLELPFETEVLGVPVSVARIGLNEGEEIVAICSRSGAGKRQQVPILDLPLPSRRPRGSEWIEAYRLWARRQ